MLRSVMAVAPPPHSILLVGPRGVPLRPFFERRRYPVVAVNKGVEGMAALDAREHHIVLLELNLGDLTATEFLMAARQAHPAVSFLLIDDQSKAGQIVKALQAGLDGYLATPPDEDRLFFEVERHLAHRSAGAAMTGPTTQIGIRPDVTELQSQLASRESALVEANAQAELLHGEVERMRETHRRWLGIEAALQGVADGPLDEASARRVKERLAMATVAETEVAALREELHTTKAARRQAQEESERLRERVAHLEPNPGSLDGPALKDKAAELEADNMVMAGRVAELEEELELLKTESAALQQKHKADVGDLNRELNRVLAEHEDASGKLQRAEKSQTDAQQKLRAEHEAALSRLRDEHSALQQKRDREHAAALQRAQDEARQASSAQQARATEAGEGRARELQAQLDAAAAERDQAVEKALDAELMQDELNTRIATLEQQVRSAEDRVQKAEQDFKRDKLRLVEEKQAAASGSHEAYEKIQRFAEENTTLKRHNTELEARRAALEERAARGDQIVKDAEADRAEAARLRAEAESTKRNAERDRERLEDKVRMLDRELTDARARMKEQQSGLEEAGTAVGRLADTVAARDIAEREVQRLTQRLGELEQQQSRSGDELSRARQQATGSEAIVGELQERIRQLEREVAEAQAAEARGFTAGESERTRAERERAELVESYEARLREALAGHAGTANHLAELEAYKNRLAETEAWVQQAQLHLSALSAEREQLSAQLLAAAAELAAKSGELATLQGRFADQTLETDGRGQEELRTAKRAEADARAATQRAEDHASALERQLDEQRRALDEQLRALDEQRRTLEEQRRDAAAKTVDPRAFAELQAELKATQQELGALRQSGGVRMPEELEPLRWTLTAAIEALTALEHREPALGAHLRNLRLLAGTLQKLAEN